jgi:hypothetical protein
LSADLAKEAVRAEVKLGILDQFEELAARAERSPVSAIRERLRTTYERVVGVPPEERDAFRVALEGVRDGGGQSVANLIEIFRRQHHGNGVFSDDGELSWSSTPGPRG